MQNRSLSRIEDLHEALAQDAASVARYPARFILVNGLAAWREVLDLLDELGHRSVRLSTLTAGDAVPNMQAVVDAVGGLDSSLVIKPLSEILRIAPGAVEAYLAWLTSFEVPGRKRLYIPLFGIAPAVLPTLERMRQYLEYSPPAWSYEGGDGTTVRVTSEPYRCLVGQRFDGIKAYLQQWESGGIDAATLVTAFASFIPSSHGSLRLEVLPTAYDVVSSVCTDHDKLRRQFGQDGQWRWLAGQLRPSESVASAAARILMLPRFEPDILWERWPHLEPNQRWLAWLWAKCDLDGASPAAEAIKESESPEQFVMAAANIVFGQRPRSVDGLDQRRKLLQHIAGVGLPASFWGQLELVSDPLTRLAALPGLSVREQEAIVESVGQLVSKGVSMDRWLPLLEITYPDLHTYLTVNPFSEWLGGYVLEYKLSRLADKATPHLLAMAEKWASEQSLWQYETRAEALHRHHTSADNALWVDGLGLEWVGLLWRKLTDAGVQMQADVVRANLPSVTAENHDWAAAQVLRGMDGYAHSHEYAYPQSIVRQIGIIDAVAQEARVRLRSSAALVLVSDHGMTRFAGAGERVAAPDGYDVHGWGRHARRTRDVAAAVDSEAWIIDGDCLILTRHGLFQGGSSTGGEVHGGATPEESLVPVLMLTGTATTTPEVKSHDKQVFLSVHGHGELHVVLTAACATLEMRLPSGMLAGTRQVGGEWVFALQALRPGGYTAELVSEGGPVGRVTFDCLRGLAENDMGL
jgi:hypothetical protein